MDRWWHPSSYVVLHRSPRPPVTRSKPFFRCVVYDVVMAIFKLKQEHIDLLANVYIRWHDAEYGAPEIDTKRPFGNSGSLIESDMCEALGLDQDDDSAVARATELYHDLDTALQIVLQEQTFEPGVFISEAYSSDWQRMTVGEIGLVTGDACPMCGANDVSGVELPAIVKSGTGNFMKCRSCGTRFPYE